jgi:hypothetical protein
MRLNASGFDFKMISRNAFVSVCFSVSFKISKFVTEIMSRV